MFEREREKGVPDELSGMSAFLGKGSRITGKLVFEGAGRIEGHVEGEVTAQDTLIIGESAVVNAQITGTAIVVHGRVTGDITAKGVRQHHDAEPGDPRRRGVRGPVRDGRRQGREEGAAADADAQGGAAVRGGPPSAGQGRLIALGATASHLR
jgi:hypothetical protein